MDLSVDLISQFAKAAKADPPKTGDSVLYGTVVKYEGSEYVRLDGSELLTPVTTAVMSSDGDRVLVTIQNHTATVTANVSAPATSETHVKDEIGSVITEVEILIADKVDTIELDAERARIDELEAKNVTITGELDAAKANIEDLKAQNVTIEGSLDAVNATIENLEVTKLDAEIADITYATIEDLKVTNATINNLQADYGEFKDLTTDKFEAVDAEIKNLDAEKISVEDAEIKFANIDFSNIGKAAIEAFFAKSGMIGDLVVGDGTITGTLIGVTIKGDLIEGGTVKADKLVIKGTDGLYYKLNTDGETVSSEQTDYNSLNGSIITAKSITAEKVNVNDLVAFGATIGGFHIKENAIHSGVKETVDNTTRGVYMDDDGQVAFGDSQQYLKFFKDTDGNYKLDISAASIRFGATNKNLEETIENVQKTADNAQSTADSNSGRLAASEASLTVLQNSISSLVTDENGSSLMEQTGDGWTFNISGIQKTANDALDEVKSLAGDLSLTDGQLSNLEGLVNDITKKTAYIKVITDNEGKPCIELGKEDSEFKVRITNTSVDFMEGNSVIAYVNNKSLYIERAVIKNDLQIGDGEGFIWKRRSNGNMGLRWIGG